MPLDLRIEREREPSPTVGGLEVEAAVRANRACGCLELDWSVRLEGGDLVVRRDPPAHRSVHTLSVARSDALPGNALYVEHTRAPSRAVSPSATNEKTLRRRRAIVTVCLAFGTTHLLALFSSYRTPSKWCVQATLGLFRRP